MRKVWIVIALALIFAATGGVGLAQHASDDSADPAVAPSSQEVAVGSGQDIGAVISQLEDDLRLLPEDHRGWAQLAIAYVEQARLSGDLTHYEKAQAAAARSFDLEPEQNFSALTAASALAGARHQFTKALTLADEALAINEYETAALAIRVDALTELGRYDEQLAALRAADRRQPGVPIAVRYAYALELRGRLGRAADLLRSSAASASRADRGFLLTLLANVQRRMGRLDSSEATLDRVDVVQPNYLESLVSRARLALARGNLEAGLKRWEEAVDRAPDVDHLVELGELYLHLGREPEAREQFARAEAKLDELLAAGQNEEHELAIFAADHGSPRVALAAARTEWGRRHSVHIADALAWALHRSGRDEIALRRARFATHLGSADALPWIHRGAIEAALGMDAQAQRHVTHGLRLEPGLNPWQVDQAERVLAELRAG